MGSDWDVVADSFIPTAVAYSASVQKLGCGDGMKSKIKNKMEIEKDIVYMIVAFLQAHEGAQKQAAEQHTADQEISDKVIEESKQEVQRAQKMLTEQPKDLVAFVHKEWAVRMLLDVQADTIEEWQEHGILTNAHAHHLMHDLEHDMEHTEKIDDQWAVKVSAKVTPA